MFVRSWNICVWCSENKQQKWCSFFGERGWKKCEGSGALAPWQSALWCSRHFRPGHPHSYPWALVWVELEKASFSLLIYDFIFCISSFLPLLLFLSFLSLERGQDTARGQIPLIPGRLWWNFQGCQIINTSFSYFKSLKSVDYAWAPTALWHHLFLEVQDAILWLLTKVRGDKHPAKLPQIHTFPPYYSSLSFHCGPRLIFKISNYILKCVLTFNICRAIKWHLFVAFQAIGFLFGCCLVVVLVEVSQTYFILFTYHKPLFSSFVLIGYGDTWNNKKRRARPYFLTTESHHYSVMVKEPHCTQKSSHQLGVVFWFWIQQISHT